MSRVPSIEDPIDVEEAAKLAEIRRAELEEVKS